MPGRAGWRNSAAGFALCGGTLADSCYCLLRSLGDETIVAEPPSCVPDEVHARIDSALASALASGVCRVDLNYARIAADAVKWLLLTALPERGILRLELWNACVDGILQLPRVEMTTMPCFAGCELAGIDLTDSSALGLEVIGGRLGFLRADRLKTAGTVLLRGYRYDPGDAAGAATGLSRALRILGGVLLSGAKIHGNLDMRGGIVGPIAGMEANETVAILADGLELDGNALLCDAFCARGELRLNGARIKRNLDISNAMLRNPNGYTLSAAGAHVDGTVYLNRHGGARTGTVSVGMVRLDGAVIEGDLKLDGGRFIAKGFHAQGWERREEPTDNIDDLYAIIAEGIKVSAGVDMTDGFRANGSVWFVLSQIGGDLDCSGAHFNFPGEDAFWADGCTVGGITFFDKATTDGMLILREAKLQQGCRCNGLTLDMSGAYRNWSSRSISSVVQELQGHLNACGVLASGTEVGSTFEWQNVTRFDGSKPDRGRITWLLAPGARIAEVNDDEASWRAVSWINLQDCAYERLNTLGEGETWRLKRLDEEYAAWNSSDHPWLRVFTRTIARSADLRPQIERFAPGPYLQLAKAYQNAGLEGGSERVLLRLERNRTRYGGNGWTSLLWRQSLDIALKYGQAPFRPVWFIIAWIIVSGFLFSVLYHQTNSAMHGPTVRAQGSMADIPDPGFKFNGTFYAIDSLVPFVDFGQKKQVTIRPLWSSPGILLLFNTFAGYAAAAFFGAGLSGLVRTGRD